MSNEGLCTIVLSCSEVGLDRKLVNVVNSVLSILEKGWDYLKRWASICKKIYLEYEYNIPLEENLTIKNYYKSIGATDTCN